MPVGELDSHVASPGDRLTSFHGNGLHDGRFFVEVNTETKLSARTNQLEPNAEFVLPQPFMLSDGDEVKLFVETDEDPNEYTGRLVIE